jgi:hypothetical protein
MLVLGALALLLWASPASADLEFCPAGEGAGQCGAPQRVNAQRGLAVDTGSGHLYVADEANNRIDVFASDGAFLFAFGWGVDSGAAALETCTEASACQAGLTGSGAGQFNRPTGVTVDNDPASANHHFVYAVDAENARVQLFDPTSPPVKVVRSIGSEGEAEGQFVKGGISIAAGPAGVLYAVDNIRLPGDIIKQRLQRFEASGVLIPPQAILLEGHLTFARAIAVDAAGNLWITGQESGLRKYSPTGAPIAGPFEPEVNFASNGLAIDATGDLYTAQGEGPFNVIAAYDPAGNILRRFAYTAVNGGSFGNSINGLAAHTSALGEVFFSQRTGGINGAIAYVFQPPAGPIVAPPTLEVKELGSAKATAVAAVNPEGKATAVHFEFVDEATYLKDITELGAGHGFDHAKSTPTKPLGAEGFTLKAAEALLGCPDPASEAGKPLSKCLTLETKYRWRVVATNADGPGGGTVEGPPFTTKESPELGEVYATRVGTDTARLNGEVNPNAIPATGFFEYVDDGAYQKDIGEGGDGFAAGTKAPTGTPLDFGAGEGFATRGVAIYPLDPGTVYHYRLIADNQVVEPKIGHAEELRTFKPPESEGCPPNEAARIGPGAFLPDCRAYEMVSPLDKAGGDIRVLETTLGALAVLEQSSDSGEKLAYGSVRSFGGAASSPFTSQYIARRVAGKEWETHPIDSPRGRPVLGTIQQFETEFRAFSANLCDAWQTTFAEPPLGEGGLAGYPNLYRRTDELCSEDGAGHYEALAPIEPPKGLPPGQKLGMKLLGVSADGEHAVFLANDKLAEGGGKGQRQLYESVRGEAPHFACILPGGGAVSVSCTGGSVEGGGEPGAQIGRISSNGERIFWSTPGRGEGKIYVRIGGTQTVAVSQAGEEESGMSASWFWGAAADGSKAIFSTLHPEAGVSDLYEFDVDTEETHPIAEGVLGVLGISEDANRVYFASSEVLSGEETNSNGDKAQAGKANLYLHEAGKGSSEFIGTLSEADLNRAVSSAWYGNHTSRVSPDGAHAAFVSVAPLTGYDNKGAQSGKATEEIYRYDATTNELSCVSCNPSGARPAGPATIPFWESPMHAARVLSDDGRRLYFQSADALTARDSNGRIDVYQWEEAGAGGCEVSDADFSPSAGGCVELVSSGQSPLDSRFVESSPSGDDVFFATGASLLPQDFGVFDIYDARVGGGLPIPPTPPPPCEGDACHAQIPAPEEPTPASSDYVAPPAKGKPAKRRCAKGKRRVSRQGKSRCVPKGEKKHRRTTR